MAGRPFVRSGSPSCIHVALRSGSLDAFFGCRITFGSKRDEAVFSPKTADFPFIRADPYLHDVLDDSCEEALNIAPAGRALRMRVANAVTPLLPRGMARPGDVARGSG